jgi:hypothetical protein
MQSSFSSASYLLRSEVLFLAEKSSREGLGSHVDTRLALDALGLGSASSP